MNVKQRDKKKEVKKKKINYYTHTLFYATNKID